MPKLRVNNFSVSLDGYGAGPDQSLDNPLGAGGEDLHRWAVATPAFARIQGEDIGTDGDVESTSDNEFMLRGAEGIGAWLMGRNMFGPIRGTWEDEAWRGWWGENPPYHVPVFVLTHHARPPLTMEGGTTFHFVTEGLEAGVERAVGAAGTKDVRVGGGVATIQQLLRARLIEELHLAIVPIFLGGGERLFDHLDGGPHGYECVEFVSSPSVAHVVLARTGT